MIELVLGGKSAVGESASLVFVENLVDGTVEIRNEDKSIVLSVNGKEFKQAMRLLLRLAGNLRRIGLQDKDYEIKAVATRHGRAWYLETEKA